MAYIDEKFLFDNERGRRLYEQYARDLPIYDFHCHLNPQEIAEDKTWKNITEIWLGGDHYKWRAMRIHGVPEEKITGDADDFEKFEAFADTLDAAPGNPLYQWSHLELARYFGINRLLTKRNAREIYDEANARMAHLSARQLIRESKVTHLNTTDSPTDDLRWHKKIRDDADFDVQVRPAFRPDPGFKPEQAGFTDFVQALSDAAQIPVKDLDDYEAAFRQRIDFFDSMGCKLADHGFNAFDYVATDRAEAARIFRDACAGQSVSLEEARRFRSYLIVFLAEEYAKRDWVMQMHIGALRNNNRKAFRSVGADAGFDSMGDWEMAEVLNGYLNDLEERDALPRVIVYNLNNKDNDVFASLMGNFAKAGVAAHVNYGSAWWFYDQKDGIEKQLTSYANFGLLGHFPGMVTDSRSFLSYTRHDYFRRVVCNLLGRWIESHMIPDEETLLKKLVQGICYENALAFFG
ncbi:MAG: glucuronate isomerase [Peptoniphilaceae bacterium]|nr:glucuronate isomerase [Peptoniphilaceae bacterium]